MSISPRKANEAIRVLQGMIEVYENEFMHGYEGADKAQLRVTFLELILQVTRYINGFTYCYDPDCRCSPRFEIKSILATESGKKILNKFLNSGLTLTGIPVKQINEFLNQISEGGGLR